MSIKWKFAKQFAAVTFFCLAGCKSPVIEEKVNSKNPDYIPPPLSRVEVQNTANDKVRIGDSYYEIIRNSQTLESISNQNKNADIRHLAAFGICTYRKQIEPKLKSGATLEQFDLELLKFSIDTQIEALNFFCNVVVANMKKDEILIDYDKLPADIRPIQKTLVINNFEKQFDSIKQKARSNFINGNDVLYTHLINWSNYFQRIDKEIIKNDLKNIDKDKLENIDGFQWRRLVLYDPTFITYACSKIWGFDRVLFEEQSLRPYKNYIASADETSREWRCLNKAFSFYVEDIQTIYDGIEKYIKTTQQSKEKRQIEDLFMKYEKKIRDAINRHACINNDFPFSVFCKKAYIEIQNCKGVYNDNEDQMEEVIHEFSRRASGADMLKQLHSAYTAKIYVQFLELVKGEMGDRWEALKTACKLYDPDEFSKTFFRKDTDKDKK